MASFWLLDEPRARPAVALPGPPDAIVVGGGVTGCSCALALASRGLRVRLHEAREIASGASGRNGGFALRGGAMPYDDAVRDLGRDAAQALWRLSERALDTIESLPGDGALHPARWVRRLALHAAAAGAAVCEHSRVETLEELKAPHVVVATDGYTHGLVPELDAAIQPTRGQVVVTEPLEAQLFPSPHYARYGYDYWQQLPDRRLVLGGSRDAALDDESTAEEAVTPVVQERLEAAVARLTGV